MQNEKLLERAVSCGRWLVANQVTDRMDANRGRGLWLFDQKTGHTLRTSSWLTGVQCMCMLALYKRTGEQQCLRAAEFAGHYIMGLQVMDHRETRYYGTIRELTTQSVEFAPRDATTAAWALVWLYEATRNPVYLDRAVLFGKWHVNHGMLNGWPLYACYMDHDIPDMYHQGSFQSGTGLFYHDLFMLSGDSEFIARGMQPIARNYRDHFFDEDGRVLGSRHGFTGKLIEKDRIGMHHYNDDFGNAMLQAAADFFADESFREAAHKNARWLAGQQQEDGGFEDKYPSGVPVSLMYFNDLGCFYDDKILLEARDRALNKLLAMQVNETQDERLDGAFRGAYEYGPENVSGAGELCINSRTTGYALMALLKLESNLEGIWLSRHNERFVDPCDDMSKARAIINGLIW